MANGLPAFEVPRPAIGQSAVPLGRLDEFEVEDRDPSAIVMPDIEAAPELLPLEFDGPAPAAQALGAVEDFQVPAQRALHEPELAFEADPASARAQLAAGVSPEFEEQQFVVQSLSDEEDALRQRGQELAFQLGSEKDPAKRTEAEQQAEDNILATQANQQQLGLARGMRDRTQAVEAARLGDALASQERRAAIDIEESALAAEREQQLDDAERLRQQQAAEVDISAARERHAQIIERGPAKPAFSRTAIAMMTEALKPVARPDGTPDYSAAVDRLMGEAKDQHAREIEAARLRSEIVGDEVGNIARARKEGALQSAVIRELTARSLRIEVERAAAGTQDEFAQARAISIVDDLKRQEAAAQATQRELANDKARKAQLDDAKRRKVEADIELSEARAGTEAAKQQQLLAKLAGQSGKGGASRAAKKEAIINSTFRAELRDLAKLDKKEAQRVENEGLFNPFTGRLLKRVDGSFATTKSPKDLRTQIGATTKANRLIEQIVATRAESGAELSVGSFLKSADGQRMQSDAAELLATLNKSMGLGSLDAGSQDILERMAGGDPTAWADPTPALRNAQKNALAGLQSDLSANAGFDGRLSLPTTRAGAPRRTLETTRSEVRQAFDRDTGNALPARSRLSSFREGQILLEEQRGGKLEAAQQSLAEANRLLGVPGAIPSLLDEELDSIQDELVLAVLDKDQGRTKSLESAEQQNRQFKRLMGIERTRIRRQSTEEAGQREREAAAVEKIIGKPGASAEARARALGFVRGE